MDFLHKNGKAVVVDVFPVLWPLIGRNASFLDSKVCFKQFGLNLLVSEGRKCHLLLEILDGFLNTVGSELANLLCFAATLKGNLDGTTLSHTISLRQAYDTNCFV